MLDQLGQIRAKIEWSKHHVREFEATLTAFLESDPYRLEIQHDSQTSEYIYRIAGRTDPPVSLSLIAGDAIHNLRSALDHLVCHLVTVNGNPVTKNNAFPIRQTAPKGKMADLAEVKGIPPAAIDLIEAAQPYRTGSDDLWKLHQLDIADKHKLLLAVGFFDERPSGTLTPIGFSGARGRGHRFRFESRLSGPIPENGAEVGRIVGVFLGGKMEHQFKLAAQIAFAQPEIVRGDVILRLLEKLADVVERLVMQFAPSLK